MKTFTFDELLKKREQREADQCRIGQIPVPESGRSLEARMPDKREVLSLYGEFAGASGPLDALEVGKHALYACCPQLQDKALQQTLGRSRIPCGPWMNSLPCGSWMPWAARPCDSCGSCRRRRRTAGRSPPRLVKR